MAKKNLAGFNWPDKIHLTAFTHAIAITSIIAAGVSMSSSASSFPSTALNNATAMSENWKSSLIKKPPD